MSVLSKTGLKQDVTRRRLWGLHEPSPVMRAARRTKHGHCCHTAPGAEGVTFLIFQLLRLQTTPYTEGSVQPMARGGEDKLWPQECGAEWGERPGVAGGGVGLRQHGQQSGNKAPYRGQAGCSPSGSLVTAAMLTCFLDAGSVLMFLKLWASLPPPPV